uniref:GPI inositol-deacylase n=1 Tax=Ditylum brightwellii TaxID=49249 RepID=A0A7S2ERA3_9STRA
MTTTTLTLLFLLLLSSTNAFNNFASLLNPTKTKVPDTTTTPPPPPTITTPIVICPGFFNDEIDYVEPLKQPREIGFVSALERRGFTNISIVNIKRSDWVRVAGGLLDPNFYFNKALPTGGGYGWYIARLKATIDAAYEESGGEKVLVIGHSAGGWLARAAMANGVWNESEGVKTADRVRCLTTVGAIHRPPVDLNSCATKGALAFTDREYPGVFLKEDGISYVTVGGDAVVGINSKLTDKINDDREEADEVYKVRGEGSSAKVAYDSYEIVSGQNGGVTGDGVVPLEWTKLEGARNIVLEGVLHSINEAGTTVATDRWYGSEGVIDRWLPVVLEEAGLVEKKNTGKSGGLFGGFMNDLFKFDS